MYSYQSELVLNKVSLHSTENKTVRAGCKLQYCQSHSKKKRVQDVNYNIGHQCHSKKKTVQDVNYNTVSVSTAGTLPKFVFFFFFFCILPNFNMMTTDTFSTCWVILVFPESTELGHGLQDL